MSNTIPEGWESTEIGSYVGVQGGCAFKSEDFCETGIPIVRISNIKKDGSIDLSGSIFAQYDTALSKFQIRNGDVLIAMSGATTGKVGRYRSNSTAYLNQRVGRFYVRDDSKVELDFVHQVTSTSQFIGDVLIDAAGGAQPNISNQQIEAFNILLPPLPEQQKIATILSSVDDVIEKTRAQIDKLKDLKTGMMQELLTKGIGHTEFKDSDVGRIPINWEPLTVRDLVKLSGGSQPPRDTFVFSPRKGYVRMLQIRDYKSDRFATYIPKDLSKRWCNKDDIMIGRYGPPIFQIMRGKEGSYNVALIKAEPKTAVLLKSYLYHFLCRKDLFQLIDSYSQRTSGQTGIDMDALNDFGFPCPPMDEQLRIADCLDEMDGRIKLGQRKLQGLESCKKALMQDLLTGKVRVKITDKESAAS